MTKNVLLYGGTFDPPTTAHASVALYVLGQMRSKLGECELWFLPSYSKLKKVAPLEHRLNMLTILVHSVIRNPYIKICRHEIEMANNAGTYAVVKSLVKTYPNIKFRYVIGSDHAMYIRNWRKSRDLVKTIPFIVVSRAGVWNHSGMYWHNEKPHIHIKKNIIEQRVSSSQVRADFINTAKRQLYTATRHSMLDTSIQEYIFDHDLYKGV